MSEFGEVLGVRTDKANFPLLNVLVLQEGSTDVIHVQSFLHYNLFTEPCGKC